MTGHEHKDEGKDGDDDGRQERDPERAAKEQFPDVRLPDPDRPEGGLLWTPHRGSQDSVSLRVLMKGGPLTVSESPMKTMSGSRSYAHAVMFTIANVNGKITCAAQQYKSQPTV